MTDNDFLQAVLEAEAEAHPGEWLSHTQLLTRSFKERGCGMTIHSRASQLRTDRGLNVECKTEREWNPAKQNYSGRVQSFYRLSKPGPQGPCRRLQGEAVTGAKVASALPDGLPGANDGADCLADAQGPGGGGTAARPPAPLSQSGGAVTETLTERGSAKEEIGALLPAGYAPLGNPPRSVSASEDAAAGDIPSTSPALAAAQPLFDMPKVAPWA